MNMKDNLRELIIVALLILCVFLATKWQTHSTLDSLYEVNQKLTVLKINTENWVNVNAQNNPQLAQLFRNLGYNVNVPVPQNPEIEPSIPSDK